MKGTAFRKFCLDAVIVYAALAALIYRSDSGMVDRFRPVPATAIVTDDSSSGYAYNYRIGDRLCHGVSDTPLSPEASPTVYYDASDVCASVTRDPADSRLVNQGLLLFVSAYLIWLLWQIRRELRQAKELRWQPS